MKKLSILAGVVMCAVMMSPRIANAAVRNPFTTGAFWTGCNYWASHAGMYMWRNWDAKTVEKDLAELSKNGVNMMRVFPLWPDFQPLTPLYGWSNTFKGFAQRDRPLSNPAAVDEEMMARFRFLCDTAKKNNIKLVVGILTGWMSGRMFVPEALQDKNVITDPVAIQWEVRFVRHFVRELKDHPAIAAWDFGNECNCMGAASAAQAWAWMNQIASAIRLEDPSRPVVSGMHSCSSRANATWNLHDLGELCDELTTHPYPLFVPECARDRFDSMRSEIHPTAESLLYAGVSGRHCFVEEAGDLGRCTGSEENCARSMRAAMFSAWAHGLGGYLWWCAFDQQHLKFPPYTWNAVERELGLLTIDFKPKPALAEMRAFRRFVDAFPGTLPPRRVDAVCIVPERADGWLGSFGAFMLAKQAGFDVAFASASAPLPDAPLYILPSGHDVEDCDPYAFETWLALFAKVEAGATALVSKGAGTRYSELVKYTGNKVDYFRKTPRDFTFAMKDAPEAAIAARDSTTTRIIPAGSDVLAADAAGDAVVTRFRYGKGTVIFVNWAIEAESVMRGDCFESVNPNPRWRVYAAAKAIAGVKRAVEKRGAPSVGLTEHARPDGGTVVVAINYAPEAVECAITVDGKVGEVLRGKVTSQAISLPANDAAVFVVER